MPIEEFRDWLQLGDKYTAYAELKRNILTPVQKELEGKALCWFNCSEKTFEKRVGKVVVGLQWKVITPELEQAREIQIEGIKNLLRVHLGLKNDDFKRLEPVFSQVNDFGRLNLRILEISKYIKENKERIKNPKSYIIQSLLRGFE